MEDRRLILATPLPSCNIEVLVIVAKGFTFGGLRLRTEVTATGLFAVQGIDAHELAQLHEVCNTASLFKGLVEFTNRLAGNANVTPVVGAKLADHLDGLLQALFATLHTAVFPHDLAQFLVEGIHRTGTIDRHELVNATLSGVQCFNNILGGLIQLGEVEAVCQVVVDGVRKNEVTIGQPLHQCGCTQAVRAVIREVRFTGNVEAGEV